MKEDDENWQIEKFIRTDEVNKDIEKLLNENKTNSNKIEWNCAANNINEELFIQNWWKLRKLTKYYWKRWLEIFIFFLLFIKHMNHSIFVKIV